LQELNKNTEILNKILENHLQIPLEPSEFKEKIIVDLILRAEKKILMLTIDKFNGKEKLIERILNSLKNTGIHQELEKGLTNHKMMKLMKDQVFAKIKYGLTVVCKTRCLLITNHNIKKSKFMMKKFVDRSQTVDKRKKKRKKRKIKNQYGKVVNKENVCTNRLLTRMKPTDVCVSVNSNYGLTVDYKARNLKRLCLIQKVEKIRKIFGVQE
jgi:hypothetical protein